MNLGKYLFEVIDRETNRPIYSRGFASIYGEWETTAEYRNLHRTFSESLRFPWPKGPVQVVLKKRDRDNSFRELWSTVIDPNSRFVNRADPPKAGNVWTLLDHLLGEDGELQLDFEDEITRETCVTHAGRVLKEAAAA